VDCGRLQAAHQQAALGEDCGDLGDVGQRRVRLVHVPAEVLERRPLVLRVALLGVQLDQFAGLGERDERDLERCLFGPGEVPGGEGALESCAGWPSSVMPTPKPPTMPCLVSSDSTDGSVYGETGFPSGFATTRRPRRSPRTVDLDEGLWGI
jgi:hypothetical protein